MGKRILFKKSSSNSESFALSTVTPVPERRRRTHEPIAICSGIHITNNAFEWEKNAEKVRQTQLTRIYTVNF